MGNMKKNIRKTDNSIAIISLYQEAKMKVKDGATLSEEFPIKVGVY